MNKILFLVSMLSTSIISSPVFGSEMQNEIDHLLTFVENMECQYERNEDMHSGKDAAKHIKRKYDYFEDEIDSTEKFIELSATKSTMSGKYYMIHCTGQPAIKAQDWLLQELNNYRTQSSKVLSIINPQNSIALVQ